MCSRNQFCGAFDEHIPYLLGAVHFAGRAVLRQEFQCKELLAGSKASSASLGAEGREAEGELSPTRGSQQFGIGQNLLCESRGRKLCNPEDEDAASPSVSPAFPQQQHRQEAAPCSAVVPWLLFTVEVMHLCQ